MMRTLSLLLVSMMLVGFATIAQAIEYNVGSPINLSVQVSAYKVLPGVQVQIRASASDSDFVVGPNNSFSDRITDPVTITWEVTEGRLQQMSTTANPIDLTWSGTMKPGVYAIVIKAADSGRYAVDPPVSKLIEITVEQPGGAAVVPTVRVGANPQTIRLHMGNSTQITAQVLGKDVANKEVRFYASRGALSATRATTDATGAAVVRLTVSVQDIGTVGVAAYYGNTTSTTTVEVVPRNPAPEPYPTTPGIPLPPPNSQGVLIDAQPATLPADGQSAAAIVVRVTDFRGYGIPQKPVLFRTTMGIIQPLSVTDPMGYARTQLVAANTPGTAIVSAQIDALHGYTLVNFTGNSPQQPAAGLPRIFLTIDPTMMMADGVSKARVEVLVLDSDSHALVGTPVYFAATLGNLQQGTVTTGPDGRAVTALTASDRPGLATISAQVGQLVAASEISFTGAAAGGPALDIRSWAGQQTGFVSERWKLRELQVQDGTQAAQTQTLQILDENAKIIKELELGKNGALITDQNGIACGYATEGDGKAQLTLLKPDGSAQRTFSMNLGVGSHLVAVQYANPLGNLLVSISQPDGTRPEVQYFNATNEPILVLRDGLEALPVMALGLDGYLVVALPGGTVRLYNASGVMVSEARRTDGLPATQAAVAPAGEWYAVASALAGQTQNTPKLSAFSRQGTPLAIFDLEATALTPVGNGSLVASTPDRTTYVNLVSKRLDWSIAGGYDHFLTAGAFGVIAGQRDPRTKALVSRVLVVRLKDGSVAGSQDFTDLRSINAVLPPNDKGLVGIVAMTYSFRFALPAQ